MDNSTCYTSENAAPVIFQKKTKGVQTKNRHLCKPFAVPCFEVIDDASH